jgi:hypothetical protein
MIGLPRMEQTVLLSALEAVPGRFRIIVDSKGGYNCAEGLQPFGYRDRQV